jgi:1-acyl-sn-glycerol-3-phosphate acyltransferase
VKRFHLARSFHAVRLSRTGMPALVPNVPLIVVLNHPSWWDPLVGLVLTELFPDRDHYWPMDADALRHYRIFERLGAFGIESATARGARVFLRTSCAILARPRTALWITAQGRFADPRERPVAIQPGVAHLVRRLQQAVILPLALEYPFWRERYPEALARFGPIIVREQGVRRTVREWRTCIEEALSSAQDALAVEAERRVHADFETLVSGKTSVGGVYEYGRSLRARMNSERSGPEHGSPGVLPAPGGCS